MVLTSRMPVLFKNGMAVQLSGFAVQNRPEYSLICHHVIIAIKPCQAKPKHPFSFIHMCISTYQHIKKPHRIAPEVHGDKALVSSHAKPRPRSCTSSSTPWGTLIQRSYLHLTTYWRLNLIGSLWNPCRIEIKSCNRIITLRLYRFLLNRSCTSCFVKWNDSKPLRIRHIIL